MTDYLLGVDVSSHQENWAGLKDDEFYGFVKSTEGKSYVNPEHDHQVSKIREAGKVVGHYHWLNDGDVNAQVAYFLDQTDIQPGDMIACDWEDSSNPTSDQKDQWIRSVQDHLGPANKVGLYCNRDWWFNHDTSSFAGDFLWIAVYTGDPDPGIEYDWTFWQYTSSPYDKNRGKFDDLDDLKAWAGVSGTPDPPATEGLWYSTDYLFPQIKPDPTNPNKITNGLTVEVTAEGGLKARTLPGGPESLDKNGDPLVREHGYKFDVTGDLVDGWVTGGTNWYSSDYLIKVTEPAKPGWKSTPYLVMHDPDIKASVSYLQAGNRIRAVDQDPVVYAIAQDYKNSGDTKIGIFDGHGGDYGDPMMIKDGGHGQTFHAYRSSAGNLYIWTLIGDYAYRIKWQPGKTITTSSSGVEKMAYGKGRPVGSHEYLVGFRTATDDQETLSVHDRRGFTDPDNYSDDPIHKVTINKRTDRTQQTWAVSRDRIYRLYGSTNETCGSSSGKHTLDVLDWSGKMLLSAFDLRNMYRPGATENEPEGLTFTGEPGSLLVGMREGGASAEERSYVWWEMTGLP